MAEANDILKQVKNVWANLGSGQKVAAAGVTMMVFAAILAAALLGGNPDYKQLITKVAPKDISGIISQLEDIGIMDYKIVAGSAIHVKSDDYELARSTLYQSGTLPDKGTDGEDDGLFAGGGMSREARIHARNLKTQKRLAKSIQTLGYIEWATVTITAKKRVFFDRGNEKAKAMVTVKTKGELSKEQIRTIAYMVSSGVESLSADAVAISTSEGWVLKAPTTDESALGQESRLAHKKQLEKSTQMAAQSLLDRVYGRNKVQIAVNFSLDWTRSNVTEKKFDTAGKIVREKSITESSKPAGGSANGGKPGNANLQKDGKSSKTAISKDSTKMEKNDYGYKQTSTVDLGGKVVRMTASVFIDESLRSVKAELERTVSAAIGIDPERGDIIEVTVAKMPEVVPIEKPDEVVSQETKETVMFYVEKTSYVLLGLAFIFFALKTIKKAQADLRAVLETSMEEENREEPVAPLTLEESVLETASSDADLAGRSLRKWLYEGSGASE